MKCWIPNVPYSDDADKQFPIVVGTTEKISESVYQECFESGFDCVAKMPISLERLYDLLKIVKLV